MRTGQWFGAGFLGVGLVVAILALRWGVDSAPVDARPPQPDNSPRDQSTPMAINLDPAPLEMIPAGTVIGDTPPSGWTNLIYLASPVLSDTDKRKLPEFAAFYAQLLRYAMLAKVEKEGETF